MRACAYARSDRGRAPVAALTIACRAQIDPALQPAHSDYMDDPTLVIARRVVQTVALRAPPLSHACGLIVRAAPGQLLIDRDYVLNAASCDLVTLAELRQVRTLAPCLPPGLLAASSREHVLAAGGGAGERNPHPGRRLLDQRRSA